MNDLLQIVNVVVYCTILLLLLISPLKIKRDILVVIFVFGLSVFVLSTLPMIRSIDYGDTKNYFDYYVGYFEFDRFELGFSWITKISLDLGLDFSSYISLVAIIISIIYIQSLYMVFKFGCFEIKAWIYAIFSSLVFFSYYYMSFEAIRDGIATSIIILASVYVFSGNFKIYHCLVLVAFLFHKASLIFIVPGMLCKYCNYKNPISYLALFVVVFVFSFLFKSALLNMSFLGEGVIYLLSFYAENKSASETVVIRYVIVFLSCLLYICLTNKEHDDQGRKLHVFIIFMVISFTFFASFPDLYRRLLLKLEYISYPLIIMSYLSKYKSSRCYLYFSLFLILYYVLFMSNYHSYYSLLNIKAVVEL